MKETSVSSISTDWLVQSISIKSHSSIDKSIRIFIDWLTHRLRLNFIDSNTMEFVKKIRFKSVRWSIYGKINNNQWGFFLAWEKHPFFLALRRWGRFARRNICESGTEISHWWRKICPESGQKGWLVNGAVTLFWLLFTNDRQKTKGHKGQM